MISVQEVERDSRLNKPRRAKRSITIDGPTAVDVYAELSPRSWIDPRGNAPEVTDIDMSLGRGAAVETMMTYWAHSSEPQSDNLKLIPPKIQPIEPVLFGSRRVSISAADAYTALTAKWLSLYEGLLEDVQTTESPSPWEAVQRDLITLQQDWENTPYTPPSEQALRDLDTVISVLPLDAVMPDVEIDDSNGEITLAWRNLADNTFVSIVVPGDQSVMLLAQGPEIIAERMSLAAGGDLELLKRLHSDGIVGGLL
jgi:hypothetical protein